MTPPRHRGGVEYYTQESGKRVIEEMIGFYFHRVLVLGYGIRDNILLLFTIPTIQIFILHIVIARILLQADNILSVRLDIFIEYIRDKLLTFYII